ncbi:hypothetical protein U9R89_22175, partial [Pectobacterium brasiliense]
MSAANASIGRQHGATGTRTRQVLTLLREPGRASDVAQELGLNREDAHALVKHLLEQGRVERLARG